MSQAYDLVVIGSGTAGWSVAIVDPLPFGGMCSLRGCNPKKALVSVVDAADWARMMKGNGVAFNELTIDWADLMAFKRSFTDPITPGIERSLARQGIEAIHGAAPFSGPNSLTVDGDEITARHVLIATCAAGGQTQHPRRGARDPERSFSRSGITPASDRNAGRGIHLV